MEAMAAKREHWSGRVGFILANISAAVGLGSVWKFPYEVGTNGGGAFVLFYLVGVAAVVLPLMLAEFAIGRHGRMDAIGSIAKVAAASHASRHWRGLGALGVAAGFLILSFYSVIGGWAIAYTAGILSEGMPAAEAEAVQERFKALLASPLQLAFYHLVFMAMTAVVVARGVVHGIEEVSKILMPLLAALIAALAVYAAIEGDFVGTLRFLLAFDTTHLTARVALEALGLGFFSIGVGFSILITYAAYAGTEINLNQAAIVTVVSDTAISLLAGFAVFPLVFAEGLSASSGPGLVFTTLPLAFARFPFGSIAAVAFFLLLLIAALGSAVSLLELAVAPLRNLTGLSRSAATTITAFACWVTGLATVLSFNLWADWFPLGAVPTFAKATVFELIDHLTSNVMLPVAGFGLSLFVGWVVSERLLADELGLTSPALATIRALLRYVIPATIAAVSIAPWV